MELDSKQWNAYMAGVLNERYGFYLSDGLWVYPNGQIIQD